MTDELPEVTAIQRIVLRPGDLVLVKYHVPDAAALHPKWLNKRLAGMKKMFREVLDQAGLKDVQVIVYTDDLDISVISAVDLLGVLTSGVTDE